MEILGIVWAASIMYPASAAAKSIKEVFTAHPQQYESLLSRESAGWLIAADRWLVARWVGSGAVATHSTAGVAAVPQSAFLPFGLFSDQSDRPPQQETFQTLVPTIGSTLTSFESPAETAVDESLAEDADDDLFGGRWHNWSAVAAVRVEPATAPPESVGLATDQRHCVQAAQAPYQPSALALKSSPKAQVWVHNQFIGEVSGQVAAQNIATQLRTLVQSGQLEPAQLNLLVGDNFVGVSHHDDLLFLVDETLQSHPEVPATVTAAQWVNNLRMAFNAEPLAIAELQMAMQGLSESAETIYGTASWYGPNFHGRQTANGEIFDENALTAAHKTLPFGTRLKVTNRLNGQSLVVRINDRGPYIGQRSLDLSKAAARCLGSTYRGVVPYEAVILEPVPKPDLGEITTAQLVD